ncbi:hypothetical protein JZ751_023671, partial [Albula glossodonta]
MPGTNVGKKLDLSRLTDEEAKHVWEVIQRDFDLRKKEEDRLGELKTKIAKEDTKRELLGAETNLTESHCIRCLQPFKFLVNSKRQCLDCQLFTCKACSRYNKKERGWVCDPCRMARVLKIGNLEWYHENVRARFKRFGSAKVMRSLYKRLNGVHGSQPDLRGSPPEAVNAAALDCGGPCDRTVTCSAERPELDVSALLCPRWVHLTRNRRENNGPREDDTHSMPDVRGVYDVHEEDQIDPSDGQRYRMMRKTKRLLSVHPLDFDLDNEYSTHSRRQSFQHSGSLEGVTRRESMIAEADMASVFQQILEEQGGQDSEYSTQVHLHIHRRKSLEKSTRSDEGQYGEHRMVRTRSLSKIAAPNGPYRHHYHDMDSSEEEEGQRFPMYQLPPRRRSRASSQENVHQAPPQINDLNKRMSAIESLLNRLEQKMTVPPEQPAALSEVELEEKKLRRKLDELTGNISDKGLSSEEEEGKKAPSGPREKPSRGHPAPAGPQLATLSSSSDDLPSESRKAYIPAGKPSPLEKKHKVLGEAAKSRYSNPTDSELSELEDKVAMAAAKVHNTESEVSDIENRIAALSAAGMSVEKTKKKISGAHQRRKASHSEFPLSQADLFVRNSLYRGSLTQRNPVAKMKYKPTCAVGSLTSSPSGEVTGRVVTASLVTGLTACVGGGAPFGIYTDVKDASPGYRRASALFLLYHLSAPRTVSLSLSSQQGQSAALQLECRQDCMRVCAVLCTLMLLLSLALPKSHGRYPQRSMEIRTDPDIDASWYTGRGIRPVGRFGRRESGMNKGSGYGIRRLCIPITSDDDSPID